MSTKKQWVKKKYNYKAIKSTIVTTLSSTIEIHTRKQVHMHSVASQLTKKFSSKLPKSFGESFSYNKVFFALYDGQPVTIDYFYRHPVIIWRFMRKLNRSSIISTLPARKKLCYKISKDQDIHCTILPHLNSTTMKKYYSFVKIFQLSALTDF